MHLQVVWGNPRCTLGNYQIFLIFVQKPRYIFSKNSRGQNFKIELIHFLKIWSNISITLLLYIEEPQTTCKCLNWKTDSPYWPGVCFPCFVYMMTLGWWFSGGNMWQNDTTIAFQCYRPNQVTVCCCCFPDFFLAIDWLIFFFFFSKVN